MKAIQILFAIQLVSQVFAVKKNVKTITAFAKQDPDLSDQDINKVMNDMATNFDDLHDQKHYDNVDDKLDAYSAEIISISQRLIAQKPLTLECNDTLSADCLMMDFYESSFEYKLYIGKFVHEDVTSTFSVYGTRVCEPVNIPTPYLENKIIKVCLTASSAAKRVAEKSVKTTIAGTFGSGEKFHNSRKYRCKHMLLDNNGGHKLESHPCVDFSEGTNLVRCFFEVHSEFKFSMNYECFYPALWLTWYNSFKKVYHAMKTKGYAITTDNLQSRYCYYDRPRYCSNLANSNQLNYQTNCTEEQRNKKICLITYNEFCDGGLLPENQSNENLSVWSFIYGNNYQHNKNEYCSNIAADGYSANWMGLYCGTHNTNTPSTTLSQWAECSNEYPLIRIKEILDLGSNVFPEAEFEKRSPTTMVMVGFNQQCKKRFTHLHPDNAPDHTDDDYLNCMEHYYDQGVVDDEQHLCTDYTNKHLMTCLSNHGLCSEYDDVENVSDDNWRVWSSECKPELMTEGNMCDPRIFKKHCFEDKWSGWNFNTGDANADYDNDGVITDEENVKFHLDMASESLMGGITDAFNDDAMQSTSPEEEGVLTGQEIIDQEDTYSG